MSQKSSDRSLRIAFITPEFVTESYFSGGLANYVNRIGLALAKLGHDVHILVRSDDTESPRMVRHADGVTVHRVSPDRLSEESLRELARSPLIGKPPDLRVTAELEKCLGFSTAAACVLADIHAKWPVDVVQASNSRGCGLFSILRTPVPVATRISCYRPRWNEACNIPDTPEVRGCEWVELAQMRLSRHIFSPSRALATMLEAEAGILDVEVIESPAYVEIREENDHLYRELLQGETYSLYVGRYQTHKGFEVLVRALETVLARRPELKAVFVGNDAPAAGLPSLKAWARERLAPFLDRLVFIGQTPHASLYPLVRNATLVTLPSLVDNQPNACLEAMMLGRPVVGTIGASFDEFITHGKNGFLVRPGDPADLAQTMLQALDREDLDTIGAEAARSLDHLAPEHAARRHAQYYRRIAEKPS